MRSLKLVFLVIAVIGIIGLGAASILYVNYRNALDAEIAQKKAEIAQQSSEVGQDALGSQLKTEQNIRRRSDETAKKLEDISSDSGDYFDRLLRLLNEDKESRNANGSADTPGSVDGDLSRAGK